MLKKSLFILFLLLSSISYSQIAATSDSIIFPSTRIDSITSSEIYIINYNNDTTLVLLRNRLDLFTCTDTLIIAPNDSALLIISYKPNQNVIDTDFLILLTSDSLYTTLIKLKGSGNLGSSLDASTFNLYDTQLRAALLNQFSNHTSLGYNTGRDVMFATVDDYGGDTIECKYSAYKIVASNRTIAQNLGFNTEHTWPQSFFGEAEPMKSDINHLFPTLADPNNRRANYDFGLPINVTWQQGGSKLGTNIYGQTVFEPRDSVKGDIARAILYFAVRYGNQGGYLDTLQEGILKSWNRYDKPSVNEQLRASRIATYQNKLNAFAYYPQLIDRIYSFTNNIDRPKESYLEVSPNKIIFDTTNIADTAYATLHLINSGNGIITVSNISFSDNRFKVVSAPTAIQPYTITHLTIMFIPDSSITMAGTLNIASANQNFNVTLSGTGKSIILSNYENTITNLDYSLEQNYPNPFNPSTTIKFSLLKSGVVDLKLYDILGNNVSTLINSYMEKGNHTFDFNADGLSSGIYFYILKVNEFRSSRKMIILK